ncbi:hypothetical protein [Gloeocapsopsis dulcis]|nr:hypothetical protein [Gloeocapsopsis dulcis]WNN88546.1 hypothetical protein P0S91_20000 [Gloeocapsopsis dulcis]
MGNSFSGIQRCQISANLPVLWTRNGDRTAFLADYCKDALATPVLAIT